MSEKQLGEVEAAYDRKAVGRCGGGDVEEMFE